MMNNIAIRLAVAASCFRNDLRKNRSGMEMVQVAILIGLAITFGLIFKDRIMEFIEDIFDGLDSGEFID